MRYIIPLYCLFLYACNNSRAEDSSELPKDIPLISESVTKVSTAIAKEKIFEYRILSEGKIRSTNEQTLVSALEGDLLQCNARTGMHVRKGDLLALVDTTNITFKLEKARLSRFANQKDYESQLLGYEQLLKNSSENEAREIKQKLSISSGLTGSELDLKENAYILSKYRITAPFSGILTNVNMQKGTGIKNGQELTRIYDPEQLILDTKILETDLPLLKIGTPAEVTGIADPHTIHSAIVTEINPYVEEDGMVIIKLKLVSDHHRRLFPGMNCAAVIRVPTGKNVIIPREALVIRDRKQVVFTMEGGKAKWNYVKTGRDNGEEVEITDGLPDGSKVITSNNLRLGNDSPVEEIF